MIAPLGEAALLRGVGLRSILASNRLPSLQTNGAQHDHHVAGTESCSRSQRLRRNYSASSVTPTSPRSRSRPAVAKHQAPSRGRPFSSQPPTRSSGSLATALLIGFVGASAYVAGSLYPPTVLSLLKPRDTPPSPSAESEEGKAHTAKIEQELQGLAMVRQLLALKSRVSVEERSAEQGVGLPGTNPSTRGPSLDTPSSPEDATETDSKPHYVVSRPYARFAPAKLLHSLTAGTLRGPGRFAVPPLIVSKTAHGAAAEGGHVGDAYAFVHLGRSLCGHNGIIHGGLLATICDEALARTAFFSLPNKVGVTARLEVDYKAPTYADQFVVVKTELVEVKGRKAVVQGEIQEAISGKVLVKARAVFVEPKFARFLDQSLVKDAMGTS